MARGRVVGRQKSLASSISLMGLLVAMGCSLAPTPGSSSPGTPADSTPAATTIHTLRMASRLEPATLLRKTVSTGGGNDSTQRPFRASLVLYDENVIPHPYLAAALPELNTDTWRVSPDGTMETTYKLRSNLTWHDGEPLTADDFAFAYNVYTTKGLAFSPTPQNLMDSVTAPDPQTLVIHWRAAYANANALVMGDLDPLPIHILAQPFQAVGTDPSGADAFMNLSYWNSDFVGTGPFRLTRWERGSFLEGEAFAGHALGKPQIDRIVIQIIGDVNATLASVLAGDLDFVPKTTFRYEHAQTLQQQWVSANKGTVLLLPEQQINDIFQFRPEYQQEPALLDPRVRQALAYATNRQELVDTLFNGQSTVLDTSIPTAASYFPDVDAAITKYPYDPQRATTLMQDAGFSRGPDGMWVNGAGHRFQSDFVIRQDPMFDRGQTIMTDMWKQAGFEFSASALPDVQVTTMDRMTFPGVAQQYNCDDETRRLLRFASSEIGTEQNRWAGSNRSGWSTPEYDQLWNRFNTTLDRGQQDQLAVEMAVLVSQVVPAQMLYNNVDIVVYSAAVHGPVAEPCDLTNHSPLYNLSDWTMS